MKNYHKIVPNKVFQEDNVEKFRSYLENIKFTKYFYKIAFFYGADKILYEIVTVHKHIEDYYELYKKIGVEKFTRFFQYYLDLETELEDYYFFKKVVNCLIRKGNLEGFIELFEDDMVCKASFNMYYYIKIMSLQKYFKGIKYLYKNLQLDYYTYNEHIAYLIKMCIDQKYDNLIMEFHQEKILHNTIELNHGRTKYFNSPLDYIIFQGNEELVLKLLNKYKFSIKSVSVYHLLKPEHFYLLIDNISTYVDEDDYKHLYQSDSIINNILEHPENEHRLKYLKYIFLKFPNFYQKGLQELYKIVSVNRTPGKNFLDFYAYVCLYITDIEVHRYYINYLSLETDEFNCNDYMPLIFMKNNLEFIKQYVREFDTVISARSSFYDMWEMLNDFEFIYRFNNNQGLSIPNFIKKIEYLEEEWGFTWFDFYQNKVFLKIINMLKYFDPDTVNLLSPDENEDESKEIICQFLEKHKIIPTYFSEVAKLPRKLEISSGINVSQDKCKCGKDKKLFKAPYNVCECEVDTNIDIKFINEDSKFNVNLRKLVYASLDYSNIYQYLEKTNYIDVNLIDYSVYFIGVLLEKEPDFFRDFISKLEPEIYQEKFLKIELNDLGFYGLDLANLKKLIEDGLDLSNDSYYPANVFQTFDVDEYYQAQQIFDMLIEYGLQNIEKEVLIMINNVYISDKMLESYIQYMTLEKCMPKILEHKRYHLLNIFIQKGYRLKYKEIRKYKLDVNSINFDKIQVAVSQTDFICVVCMTNTPSVVFLPCGHFICCQECYPMLEGKCPFDKQDIQKKISYAPTSEENAKKCDRCLKTDFEYVFDTCGHRLCKKCSFRNKCSKCLKTGNRHRIYWA